MNLPDDYTVMGPNGQHMNCGSLDGIMKIPMLADGILNMVANDVRNKWEGFQHKTVDSILTLRAHGRISKVEDVIVIFIDELFKNLTPFHSLYTKVFEREPIDYATITNIRTYIAQLKNKYLPGLPAEQMICPFVSVLPNTIGLNVVDVGMAYQALMFFHEKARQAAVFSPELLEANRENFLKISSGSWRDLLATVTFACKTEIPEEVARRSKSESREYDRLVREGVERNAACEAALTTVRQAGSKNTFYGWFDKEFDIDTDAC